MLGVRGLTRRTWRAAVAAGQSELHPAARTFQALRILVNDELQGLDQLLRVAPYCLQPGGRLGILTFHSGEDRRVKHALRDGLRDGVYVRIAEKPQRPSPAEQRENPRSTSAKFRWAVRAAATSRRTFLPDNPKQSVRPDPQEYGARTPLCLAAFVPLCLSLSISPPAQRGLVPR